MLRIETHFQSLIGAGAGDIVSALAFRAAERPSAPASILLDRGEDAQAPLTYAALWSSARRVAATLAERLSPSSRVILAFPAGGDFVVALFACFLAGMIAVPAPPPRGSRGRSRLGAIARDCDATLLLTTSDGLGIDALPVLSIGEAVGDEIAFSPPDPEAVALLQYTSGSTGAPKGVVITHRAIWHNQSVIRTCFDHAEGVALVGWLPNFHDMGLIGNLLQPLYAGGVSVILPPAAFLQKPMRWLRAVSRYRAHTSGAPNFAYDLCARAATDDNCAGLDLSVWRVAFNGAEPVRARTLEAFAARFAPHGFRREAFMPCYGLAESTLMVTGSRVGAGAVILSASKAKLADGVLAPGAAGDDGTDIVSCGDEVAGAAVRVADPRTGAHVPDGRVGEVLVRSESVCGGYWGNPRATRAAFRSIDGELWLRTGDLAARRDGQLHIVGRAKEVLIVNGRNIHPADIEDAALSAAAAQGVTRAIASGAAGALSEDILLFVEVSREGLRGLEEAALYAALRQCAMQVAEAPLAAIVVAKQGALPLTSSGKVRRGACRDLFLAGALPGIVALDAGADKMRDAAPEPRANPGSSGRV